MNATARDLPGEATDETIVHEPKPNAVPSGSAEADAMPNTTQGQNRYTFGSGARPLEGYTIKRAIGRGGFGEVYYATSDAGKEVALKLITRNIEIERRGVMQCMNLKSPHLITIYDLKTNDEGDTFVIMEYVAGPSLENILRQHPNGLPLHEVRMWLKGLVEGVAYLHDHGIVHRDLKPANLFLEQGLVKIGDYGLSKLITTSQGFGHSESIGTCHYMAPEISTGKYNKPIDIYAIGVILYEMISGRVPFEGETVGEVLMKHLTARPDLAPIAEPYRAIVANALAKDPAERPVRVFDLLSPEDVPKTPTVRFIGDGKVTPPTPEPEPQPKASEEDVLRIEAEEPVFYIGPDTKPPRRRGTFPAWFWGRPCARPVRKASYQRPVPAPRPGAQPRPMSRPVPPPPPRVPEPPPPLPAARVRVAELATAMLWSAPLTAILTLPAAAMLGVDLMRYPQQLAYLFAITLLGAWGVLMPHKLWEGRPLDKITKRLTYLAVGLGLGAVGLALGEWTDLRLKPSWHVEGPSEGFIRYIGPLDQPNLLSSATYFGLVLATVPWWRLTARDRRSRFRIFPVFLAGLIALLMSAVWPYPQPWGAGVASLIAIVAQVVSPWSEPAARYNRATRNSPYYT
jgi:serine/threonine protein kinase